MTEQECRNYLLERTFEKPSGWMGDLVSSTDWRHRWYAARMRCGLSRLMSDSSADVRIEVAWQKYRLGELKKDPDPRVSWAAKQCETMSWEDVYDRYTNYEMDYEGLLELLNNDHIVGLVSHGERDRVFKKMFDEGWPLEGGNMRIWVEKTCCPELVCETLKREKCNFDRTLILTSHNRNGREIRDVIAEQFGVERGRITSCTPEDFSALLLRKYAHKVGLNPLFTIVEDSSCEDEVCKNDLIDSAFALMVDHRDVMAEVNSMFDWILDEDGNGFWTGGVRVCDMLYCYKITDDTKRRWYVKSDCWMSMWHDRVEEIYRRADNQERIRLESIFGEYWNYGESVNAFKNRWWIGDALDAVVLWEPELAEAPRSQQFEIAKYVVEWIWKNKSMCTRSIMLENGNCTEWLIV